jgi:hypothetical protein
VSSDQGASFVREGTWLAVIVSGSFRDRSVVVAPDPSQDNGVESVGTCGTSLLGSLVGIQQGVGHRQRPQLPGWVGVANANNALKNSSPSDMGSRDTDSADGEFQDRWEYGIGKIAEFSGTVAEELSKANHLRRDGAEGG